MTHDDASSYAHGQAGLLVHHDYLLPAVERILGPANGRSLFEVGFGNGSVAAHLTELGFKVTGIEPSEDGLALARQRCPRLTNLHQGDVYDPQLVEKYRRFPAVLSLEVVEHVYAPRKFAASVFSLLQPGGVAILSTPYHGYLKNVAVALAGKFDHHVDPLWDHGHIKFWSMRTLSILLFETGFRGIHFIRTGRIPPLAKSMIAVATRP